MIQNMFWSTRMMIMKRFWRRIAFLEDIFLLFFFFSFTSCKLSVNVWRKKKILKSPGKETRFSAVASFSLPWVNKRKENQHKSFVGHKKERIYWPCAVCACARNKHKSWNLLTVVGICVEKKWLWLRFLDRITRNADVAKN